MTAFTELSEALLAEELADTIERFNATTADVIAQRSGRVVKTISDEVMFTTSDPVRGAEVAVACSTPFRSTRGRRSSAACKTSTFFGTATSAQRC
jgi:adenylate cyclase